MTLILTLANSSGVYQSSDYQLTDRDTGVPVSDRAGVKQLQASFRGLELQLAFTGIASVGSPPLAQRTIDWLSAELKELKVDSQLQDICEALAKRCATAMKPHGSRGVLTLILTVAVVREPFRIVVISNADWRKRPPVAKPTFTIAVHTITKPFQLISGCRESVPAFEQHRLHALSRATEKSSEDMLKALAEINSIAAKHSGGYVSGDCWVTSQIADGRARRSAARNVGQNPGDITHLVGGVNLSESSRKNFRAPPGQEYRLKYVASVTIGPGDGTPVPAPQGEPRRYTVSGSPVATLLRSPLGDHCASLEIIQLDCVVDARCNDLLVGPFMQVRFNAVRPICSEFPTPLLPWPLVSRSLSIDAAAVPRGWEQSVGYWIEGHTHRVSIPESHRSIRNLAFLDDDEELVIVAPSETADFAWAEHEDPPTAVLNARLWWRKRLDGTRG
jgi:hypothetical protein